MTTFEYNSRNVLGTRTVFATLRERYFYDEVGNLKTKQDRTGKRVGGKMDWTSVSAREVYDLSERMFDAARVPQDARDKYYREFYRYIYR